MASVSRLDTLIRRCLYTGFFLLPLVFNAWTFEKFELTKILLFYGMVLIAGLLVSVKLLADGELRIPKNRLFAVVVSLGIIFFLSSVVSVHPQTSFLGYYLRFNGSFLHYAALICMLLVLDNCRSNSLYERLFRLSVAAGVLTSIYGIVQWFGWDFKTFNIVGIRALSTFGEPTNLAGFLAIILPFTLMYVMIARSRREKIVYSASTVAVYFCLLLTYSRGAYLAAGCAVCILFVALFINRRQINLREISPYLGLITIACVLVTVYVFTVPRTITSAFQNRETSTLSIRLEVWKTVPVLVAERPLLGSGLETFAYAFSRHRPVELNYYPQWESRFDRAHNEFFNILVTTGIVGFLVYVLLFGMLTASLWKQFQNQGDTGKRLEIAAVGAGLAAYAVHNSFAFSSTTTLAVFFLFISYVESGHAHKLILISRKNIGLVLSGICITTTCLYGFFAVQVVRGDMYFSAAERIEPSDPVRALNLYRDAVQVNPDNDRYWKELSRICFHLAVLYSTEEQLIDARATALLDEAIRAAERAAALNPHKPNNYGVLAVGLYEMGKYDSQYYQSAEEAALHAHNLEPTDVRLVELLALLSMRQGRWSDADNAFQTAYALKKDLPSLLQNMGIFYYDISQYAAAAEYFRQLQEIDPSNTTSQEYLQRLGSLAD